MKYYNKNKGIMKHYVYFHSDPVTGEVFYIGHGTLARSRSKRRTQLWTDKASKGYRITLVTPPISKAEAHELEFDLIERYSPQLVNKSVTRCTLVYDVEMFREFLYYDETSPTRLRWKKPIGGSGNQRKCGDVAGTAGTECRLTFKKRSYIIPRVIWLLFNGSIDNDMVVDHLDGNRLNNSISNLRLVPQSENMRNKSLCKKNVSGLSGVFPIRNKGRQVGWRALYSSGGESHYMNFSFCKYIDEDFALELAKDWRMAVLEQLAIKGEFYTERHLYGIK